MPAASLLIVEDEALVAWDLAEFLKARGYRVVGIVDDKPTAIHVAEDCKPDLALVDVRLARGDSGLDVARELRDRLGIPSIHVTGHLDDAQAVREGAFGIIHKPYLHNEVANAVEAGLRWIREGRAEDPPHALIPTRKPPRPRHAPTRVLVVDDNMADARFVEKCLRDAGYHVETVLSGRDAVALCADQGAFDAVVLDIFMPEQDGLETLRALRQCDPKLRIVAMASPLEGGPLDFLRYARVFGAHATLDKPFSGSVLLETLARVAS